MTATAIRLSGRVNGVARRHGEVSRELWQQLWPGKRVEDVPIGHVTNGVHLPTWMGSRMLLLLDRHLGADWLERLREPGSLGVGADARRCRSCGACTSR